MNKIYTLIVVLAILAIAGFSLFFMNQSRLAQQEADMNERIAQLEAEQQQ